MKMVGFVKNTRGSGLSFVIRQFSSKTKVTACARNQGIYKRFGQNDRRPMKEPSCPRMCAENAALLLLL